MQKRCKLLQQHVPNFDNTIFCDKFAVWLINVVTDDYETKYCTAIEEYWCPYKLGDIKEIEKVQKRATKLIIKLKINHTETDYFI